MPNCIRTQRFQCLIILRMFGQFGQKQYYNMGGPGGPPQRHGQNNQMPFDEQE